MDDQLASASQAGIGFFVFDWYYNPAKTADPFVDNALNEYLQLPDHCGVGFAIQYVNWDQTWGIPTSAWQSEVQYWVNNYFTNPSYVRVNGEPVFVIYYLQGFLQEWNNDISQANQAIQELRDASKQAGLPGVFVVAGIYSSPTDSGFTLSPAIQYDVQFNVDALSQYNYPGVGGLVNGSEPYHALVSAGERLWAYFGANSSLPYIPVVTAGWDPRPWGERVMGDLFWYTRNSSTFGSFMGAALAWARTNDRVRLGTQPVIFLEAWNELGEGSYVVPTLGEGSSYLDALAQSLSLEGCSGVGPSMIVFAIPSSGAVVNSGGSGCYSSGSSVAIVIAVNQGYQFVNWTGYGAGSYSGNSQGPSVRPSSGPITEIAQLEPSAAMSTSEGGSVTYSYLRGFGTTQADTTDDIYVPFNTELSLSAVPSSLYRFVAWSGEVNATGVDLTLVVDSTLSLSATFAELATSSSSSSSTHSSTATTSVSTISTPSASSSTTTRPTTSSTKTGSAAVPEFPGWIVPVVLGVSLALVAVARRRAVSPL